MTTLRFSAAAIAASAMTVGVGPTAWGQCGGVETATLLAGDAAASDHFGSAVAVSGDVAVVGARLDDDNGLSSGSIYFFRFDGEGWYQEQKLSPVDGWGADQFGISVDIEGDVAIVGAYLDDDNGSASGSAYIFRYVEGEWVEEDKIIAADGASADLFGFAVGISGDVAVVGAYQDTNSNGWYAGSAYVFRYDGAGWYQEEKLTTSDGVAMERVGYSVAASDGVVAVGAYYDDDNGTGSGSVYLYRDNGAQWVEEAKLLPADGFSLDQFGNAVALDGDVLAVGSYEDDDHGTGSGSVYVYRRLGSSWNLEQKVTPSDAWTQDHFGISVDVSGDLLVVGAEGNDDGGTDSGSAYAFEFDGLEWVETDKMTAPDADSNDYFGQSVAVSGGIIVIGSQLDDSPAPDAGSVCLFSYGDAGEGMPDCNENGIPDVCDIADGESSDMNNNGIPDECEDPINPDVNGDGVVNVLDLLELVVAWGICEGECPEDINNDGFVDIFDLAALLESWQS